MNVNDQDQMLAESTNLDTQVTPVGGSEPQTAEVQRVVFGDRPTSTPSKPKS
jgi:hypothetical protein